MESERFSASDKVLFYFLHKERNVNEIFHSTIEGLARAAALNKRTVMKGIKKFEKDGIIDVLRKIKGRNAGFAWIFSERYRGLHNKNYESASKKKGVKKGGETTTIQDNNPYYT